MPRSLALLALAGLALPAEAQTPAPAAIRVASNASDDITPLLYAQKTGMFAKAGLDVTFTKMSSGAAVTAAVVGGSIDLGKSSIVPLIAAHVRGFPLRLVAPGEVWISDAPVSGLVVRKESPIASARDLAGKTVSVTALGDLNHLSARAWIDQNGGDATAVHFIEVPGTAAQAALLDGRVDAVDIGTPVLTRILASGKVRMLGKPDDAIAKRFLISGYFGSDAFLTKNAAAIVAFARVLRDAAAYTNTHHADTLTMTADFSGIDVALLATMVRSTVGLALDPHEIQPLIDATAKYGEIPQAFDARDLISPIVLAR